MGLPAVRYIQLNQLDDTQIQTMIDHIIKDLSLDLGERVSYTVQSGKQFMATKAYFLHQGHELEAKIKNQWPQLNRIAQKGDNVLKNYMLDRVWSDYPEYISTDFVDLFKKIQ